MEGNGRGGVGWEEKGREWRELEGRGWEERGWEGRECCGVQNNP